MASRSCPSSGQDAAPAPPPERSTARWPPRVRPPGPLPLRPAPPRPPPAAGAVRSARGDPHATQTPERTT
ncbi:hypothetical protein FCI23_55555 [Actinacidiphila oryziradicis]|uniref:Uncharacterized protein n=1 Tax=Actinacidiphila oryziradicis TaxID=2571141 RepID=A0A4U0R887_9ACTN|nr:hypothetical protein FCI23_55555 [Actinacidiphila oryziradicis]